MKLLYSRPYLNVKCPRKTGAGSAGGCLDHFYMKNRYRPAALMIHLTSGSRCSLQLPAKHAVVAERFERDQQGPYVRISWLRHYPRNPLFRIRRLEYCIKELHRRRKSGHGTCCPYGADIAPRSVVDSFRTAIEFFQRCFRSEEPAAFESESWVFSPILESLIGSGSNAVRLQKTIVHHLKPAGNGESEKCVS